MLMGCGDPSSLRSVGMTRRANSGFPFKRYTFILAPHRFAELTLDYNQEEQLWIKQLHVKQQTTYNIQHTHYTYTATLLPC